MSRRRASVRLSWGALLVLGCGGGGHGDRPREPDAAAARDTGVLDAQREDAQRDAAADAEWIDASALNGDTHWAWVNFPAGSFEMGAGNLTPPGDLPIEVFIPDGPKHTVQVAAFAMTRAEITVAQYRLCARAGACSEPNTTADTCSALSTRGENNWLASGRDDHPINCLSPAQGAAFCAWAGGRLPSEAEWEYAARSAGQAKLYAWGDEAPSCDLGVLRAPASCADLPDTCVCGGATQPVCSKPAGSTAQGLCDATGNVAELVADAYHRTYEGAPRDSKPWGSFGDNGVARGGSCKGSDPYLLQVTSRIQTRASPHSTLGIRCAR